MSVRALDAVEEETKERTEPDAEGKRAKSARA